MFATRSTLAPYTATVKGDGIEQPKKRPDPLRQDRAPFYPEIQQRLREVRRSSL